MQACKRVANCFQKFGEVYDGNSSVGPNFFQCEDPPLACCQPLADHKILTGFNWSVSLETNLDDLSSINSGHYWVKFLKILNSEN